MPEPKEITIKLEGPLGAGKSIFTWNVLLPVLDKLGIPYVSYPYEHRVVISYSLQGIGKEDA